MHFRVLQEITSIDSRLKIWRGKKLVMFAVDFTSPWHSRRAGDGIKKLPTFSQGLNDSGFSRARRSGDEKENSVMCESHQIVILSEAKNLRLLLSSRLPKQEPEMFRFAQHDKENARFNRSRLVVLRDSGPFGPKDRLTQDFELARGSSPVRPCNR